MKTKKEYLENKKIQLKYQRSKEFIKYKEISLPFLSIKEIICFCEFCNENFSTNYNPATIKDLMKIAMNKRKIQKKDYVYNFYRLIIIHFRLYNKIHFPKDYKKK